MDALRRIGSKAAMALHAELTTEPAAVCEVIPGGEGDGEEEEEEGEEEEGEEEEAEEEREARKVLAAQQQSREVFLPSVHPHPLEPCYRHCNYCDVRGPGCKYAPTTYTCTECVPAWDICQTCFDKAPRDEAGPSAVKDSLADLLHEISLATHDEEDGDAGEDDMGDAIAEEDDDDVDINQLFRQAQAQRHADSMQRDEEETEEEEF